jgi:hypothetical protein
MAETRATRAAAGHRTTGLLTVIAAQTRAVGPAVVLGRRHGWDDERSGVMADIDDRWHRKTPDGPVGVRCGRSPAASRRPDAAGDGADDVAGAGDDAGSRGSWRRG